MWPDLTGGSGLGNKGRRTTGVTRQYDIRLRTLKVPLTGTIGVHGVRAG